LGRMRKPRICAVIVDNDLNALREVEPFVDLFELRIDLVGHGWQELAPQLKKPWIACNRRQDEGGNWPGNEARRIEKLLEAMELGANIVDVELRSSNLDKIVKLVKKRTRCLLSFHDLEKTPPLDEMIPVVQQELAAGADICKLVTTARGVEDNLRVLRLFGEFPGIRLTSFAMGPLGTISRVLCPLVGSDFTYASMEKGKESAHGQLTARDLLSIYDKMTVE